MSSNSITPDSLRALDADEAVARLGALPDATIAQLLRTLGPGRAVAILDRFGAERRRQIAHAGGQGDDGPWLSGQHWPQGTVGRLMEPPRPYSAPRRRLPKSSRSCVRSSRIP